MLKLLGSMMIFGACAALGLSARQTLRRRVAAADAMLTSLTILISEITCRHATIPEMIGQLGENENEVLRTVFTLLQRRLREQTGLSLGYLWRAALHDTQEQTGLGAAECEILCDAAHYLGRYDAAEQAAGLQQIARRLTAAREIAAEELQNKGNLYRTCGMALGLLVVLVLI